MPPLPLRIAIRILSTIAPEGERETLVGDLVEEYLQRSHTQSNSSARRWLLRQLGLSIVPLFRASLVRVPWISTAGAALISYMAVGLAELIVNRMIASVSRTGAATFNPLGVSITFPLVVLIAYVAAGFRRGAAGLLALMMLLAVAVMTWTGTESVPHWYRVAYFIAGPAAACTGAALRALQSSRS